MGGLLPHLLIINKTLLYIFAILKKWPTILWHRICKEKADLISFTSSSSLLLTKSLICWNKILRYGTVIRINYCLQKSEDFSDKEKLKVNLRNHDETVHEAWGHAAEARISDKFFNFFKPSVDFIVCEIGVKITHIPSAEMVQWYNYLRNLSYLLEAGRHLMNVVISEQVYFINLSLILDNHEPITYEWKRTLI